MPASRRSHFLAGIAFSFFRLWRLNFRILLPRSSLMLIKIILGLAFTLLLCGCPTARTDNVTQAEQIYVLGPYQHVASGMIFPTSVGDYIRDRIIRYDRDALDVSAGYNLILPPRMIYATMY